MSRSNPYQKYENTMLWRAIERGIADLAENGDLTETTARQHIVGYLTKLATEELTSVRTEPVSRRTIRTTSRATPRTARRALTP